MKELLGRCYLCGPCRGYITRASCQCGGGVEYLHRNPASRRRRQKRKFESETVKYGSESHGIRTRELMLWRGPAAYTKDRPVPSSERAPQKKQDGNCQRVINIWGSTTRLTDWLTVSRNLTLTFSLLSLETLVRRVGGCVRWPPAWDLVSEGEWVGWRVSELVSEWVS
jgi:hypothetical protein